MNSHDPNSASNRSAEQARLLRVEQVFFEVSGLAPLDRDAAIARLCAGDPALEAEVRSLVGSAARIGSFLEQPALGKGLDQLAQESNIAEPPDDLVGKTLGNFRIEKRLASGGMGTVYLARRSDGQFEQQVAIKVVKRGMDSEEVPRRFRAERQTLAALDHPNIARLLDGGVTPDGRPFLVMEYVDGEPIDVYCDKKRLKVNDRLRLFRDVCEGVHHAHKNLVIHRDIKPSNILVTSSGVPKLLDFGIAKVLSGDPTVGVTAETDRRLTPEYASPEQVEGGAITTASDVYALGVVLYEVLTGTRPYYFGLRTHEELRRVVCEIVPPAPSEALTLKVARLKGTGSAAVAASGGTVSPPSTDSHASASGVDVPKTRGVSSTRLRNVLRGDLDNIVLMALRKEPQRRYASAEQLAGDLGRYLAGMPVQARQDTSWYRASKFVRRHALGVSLSVAAVALLSGASVMLYKQRGELRVQRDELIAGNQRLQETRRFLLDILGGAETGSKGPDATLGTVVRDAAKSLQDRPPGDVLTKAAAEQALGRASMSLGMLPEARVLLESASRGYASLSQGSATRSDLEVDLAELAFLEGKNEDAEKAFRVLLSSERVSNAGKPTAREGLLLNDLGAALRAQGKLEDAAAAQREAVAIRTAVHGGQSLEVAESQNNLASSLFQLDKKDESIALFEASLAIRRSLLRPDHPLIVRGEANLGLVLSRVGRLDDAATMLIRSAEAWDKAFGPEHSGRVATITSLAQTLRKQSKPREAIGWLEKALAWQRVHQAQNATAIAATEANIAIAAGEAGDDAAAVAGLERVLPILTASNMTGITKAAQEALAAAYDRAGRVDDAKRIRDAIKK
ncbi:MAG: serine/threonine-protein kinase [Phycisphaerales bacterium]|nr:serine/threonine-protein kinase [Phycisphaerales bacterium]